MAEVRHETVELPASEFSALLNKGYTKQLNEWNKVQRRVQLRNLISLLALTIALFIISILFFMLPLGADR